MGKTCLIINSLGWLLILCGYSLRWIGSCFHDRWLVVSTEILHTHSVWHSIQQNCQPEGLNERLGPSLGTLEPYCLISLQWRMSWALLMMSCFSCVWLHERIQGVVVPCFLCLYLCSTYVSLASCFVNVCHWNWMVVCWTSCQEPIVWFAWHLIACLG